MRCRRVRSTLATQAREIRRPWISVMAVGAPGPDAAAGAGVRCRADRPRDRRAAQDGGGRQRRSPTGFAEAGAGAVIPTPAMAAAAVRVVRIGFMPISSGVSGRQEAPKSHDMEASGLPSSCQTNPSPSRRFARGGRSPQELPSAGSHVKLRAEPGQFAGSRRDMAGAKRAPKPMPRRRRAGNKGRPCRSDPRAKTCSSSLTCRTIPAGRRAVPRATR